MSRLRVLASSNKLQDFLASVNPQLILGSPKIQSDDLTSDPILLKSSSAIVGWHRDGILYIAYDEAPIAKAISAKLNGIRLRLMTPQWFRDAQLAHNNQSDADYRGIFSVRNL